MKEHAWRRKRRRVSRSSIFGGKHGRRKCCRLRCAKGDEDRAIIGYSKAIEIHPKYREAFVNRGNSYHAKGDEDRAILDYNRAIEIHPKYRDAFVNRGNAYHAKGDGHFVFPNERVWDPGPDHQEFQPVSAIGSLQLRGMYTYKDDNCQLRKAGKFSVYDPFTCTTPLRRSLGV